MNQQPHLGTRGLPTLSIMGVRGIPARHGGFETFVEKLAPFLAERGWAVTVYCQEDRRGPLYESRWGPVRRVHVGVGPDTPLNTVRFDWACIAHAVEERPSLVLTLGYNTAIFGLRLRVAGIPNVMNMDGIEWSRGKWGRLARAWLYLNERAGCSIATHLVADHPEIAAHLRSRVAARKITTIPYGAPSPSAADVDRLAAFGLEPGGFATIVARAEPENSILEMVAAFSARRRGLRLAVVGPLDPALPYHAQILAAASDEVVFTGALYDPPTVQAIRQHAALYLHGHRVGGTNPSLLEAMGAGNAVLAHDNRFNRWVVGSGAEYFRDVAGCSEALDRLLANPARRGAMAAANRLRARSVFDWADVLAAYGALLREVHLWEHGRPSWPQGRGVAPNPLLAEPNVGGLTAGGNP